MTLEHNNLKAQCIYDHGSRMYTLKKGSEIILNLKKTIAAKHQILRDELIKDGYLVVNVSNDKYILNKDIVFSSPSAASCFVIGASSDGFELWKINGTPLDAYRSEIGKTKSKRNRKK